MTPTHKIKNFSQQATTPLRQSILSIAEAGLAAIDTKSVIKQNIRIANNHLIIKDQVFDLSGFKKIKVIGFGKASCPAAEALEEALGQLLDSGVAIGISPAACELIDTYEGTHPQASYQNVAASEQVVEISKGATSDDLVIVVVSGGGSALLCWPKTECDQSQILYHHFLKTGGSIDELNIVRKHLSLLKGGGLAKFLYPATVVGLIFSDVPGDRFELVASGPTYLDESTIADAQAIIKKYNLPPLELIETPKDPKYFEKISNIPLVTNQLALEAMQTQAQALGYTAVIATHEAFDEVPTLLGEMKKHLAPHTAVLAGGEPKIKVETAGSGGRNLYVALNALKLVTTDECFLAFASDGLDNSPAAGAIVDTQTREKAQKTDQSTDAALANFDGYNYFEKLEELVVTGPTQANVSDLFIWLKL